MPLKSIGSMLLNLLHLASLSISNLYKIGTIRVHDAEAEFRLDTKNEDQIEATEALNYFYCDTVCTEKYPFREIEVTNDWRLEMLWTR